MTTKQRCFRKREVRACHNIQTYVAAHKAHVHLGASQIPRNIPHHGVTVSTLASSAGTAANSKQDRPGHSRACKSVMSLRGASAACEFPCLRCVSPAWPRGQPQLTQVPMPSMRQPS